jgi:hypothetical protein
VEVWGRIGEKTWDGVAVSRKQAIKWGNWRLGDRWEGASGLKERLYPSAVVVIDLKRKPS